MDLRQLAESLHPLEKKVLPLINQHSSFLDLLKGSGLRDIELHRALQWLESKGIIEIKTEESVILELGSNGAVYVDKLLPEHRFLKAIAHEGLNIEGLAKHGISNQEVSVSLGLLKKEGLINFVNGIATITTKGLEKLQFGFSEEKFLEKVSSHIINVKDLSEHEKNILSQLKPRKEMIAEKSVKDITVALTALGKSLGNIKVEDTIDAISSDMIKRGEWKTKKFRRYDVGADVPRVHAGRKHPLTAIMDMIREIFIDMGFEEMKGPYVETSFWCLDSMWIPQDHPARDAQDTFFLPYTGTLPDDKLVKKVANAHETGANTGSKGYCYKWNPEMSKQLLLRTHTTATTYRYFGLNDIGKRECAKFFYIGRVFRNEAIDATHLPEFHQVEGFVMGEGLSLNNLMGLIKEFYARMGIDKIKFKVTYNPYTEPSLEAMYYNEKRGKWLELINSGMFRPESLAPYGIDKPVLAWGLGVERLAMTLYELDKLKDILGASCDLEWLRKYKIIMRNNGNS